MATPQELRDAMAQAAATARQPVPPTEGQRVRRAVAANEAAAAPAGERIRANVAAIDNAPVQQRLPPPGAEGQRIRSAVAAATPVTHNLNPPVQVQSPIRNQLAGLAAEPGRALPLAIDAPPPPRPGGARAQILPPAPAQPFYNRPLNMQPAMDAAKASGRMVQRVVAPLARVAGPAAAAGAIVGEGVDTAQDVATPGMTGLDQTGRVGEGIARGLGTVALGVKGAAAGASLGALGGPLAPITVPVGAALGGIGGAAAGYLAPDAANNVYNWAQQKFGGRGDNQLPSARAAELQAQQRPAPVATAAAQMAPPVVAPVPAVAPAVAPPPAAARSAAPRSAPPKRPPAAAGAQAGARGTAPSAPSAPPPSIDGGMQPIYTNAPNRVSAFPGANVQVVGPGERFAPGAADAVPASITDGQLPAYLGARQQQQIDQANPLAAKTRSETTIEGVKGAQRLQEQALQNEGSARSAAISAGPGYAHAKTASQRLVHEKAQDKVKIIGGGQEPVFDPATGMYLGMRTVPQRAIRQRAADGEPPVPTWEDALAPAEAGSTGKAPPKVGEVVKGHKFKGGDPAKASNWEKQ